MSSALMRHDSNESRLNSMAEVKHDSSSRKGSGLDISRQVTSVVAVQALLLCRRWSVQKSAWPAASYGGAWIHGHGEGKKESGNSARGV